MPGFLQKGKAGQRLRSMPGRPNMGKSAHHGDVTLQAAIRRAKEHAPDQAGPRL